MKNQILILSLSIAMVFLIVLGLATPMKGDFESRREIVLNDLSLAIDDAVVEGKYSCCIDPPCTMCYLGKWLWDDGICRCDEMIRNGDFDSVCPECKNGIEEGACKSSASTACEV